LKGVWYIVEILTVENSGHFLKGCNFLVQQLKVRETDDLRANSQVNADLQTLISVLESPVFQSILSIQDSLKELKKQVVFSPRFCCYFRSCGLGLRDNSSTVITRWP
jgi:hypothetical protein